MFLRAARRAGQEPKIGLPSGSLAVLCPACPQPNKNMDPDQPRGAEESYVHLPEFLSICLHRARFLDMFFYTIDGNFQASQKLKPMDETDYLLTTGASTYANEVDYEIYRTNLPPRGKEVSLPTESFCVILSSLVSQQRAVSSGLWAIPATKDVSVGSSVFLARATCSYSRVVLST